MTLGKASTIVLLGLYLSIAGLNRFAIAAEPDKINVCYSSIAATSITTWVPKEAGIYKKYGLDVSIIYVEGAQAITTLISGDTQIVQGSGAAAALSAREQFRNNRKIPAPPPLSRAYPARI